MMELVVALGICSIGLVVLIGLLAQSAREAGLVAEAATAERVFAAVQAEVAVMGAPALVTALVERAEPATDANALFANHRADRIGRSEDLPPEQRFFAIVLERDADLSPPAAHSVAGFVAYHVRIEWPFRRPDGTRVDAQYRNIRRFPSAEAR